MRNKSLKRVQLITNNTIRQVLISLFGIIIPFLVIRFSSKETWGSFVPVFLFCLLALQFINWGSKEYLLRKFSQKPAEIIRAFSENAATRFPLVFIFAILAIFLFPLHFGFWILLWLIGRYISHSIEALLIYEKKFSQSMLIETASFLAFGFVFLFLKSGLDIYSLLVIYSLYQFLRGIMYLVTYHSYFSFSKARITANYFQLSFSFFLLSIMGFLVSRIDVYIIERFGNKVMTSDYQIINNLLVFAMSVSAFIYTPFTKIMYRNTSEVLGKSKKMLAMIGIIIVPVALIVIHAVNLWFLKTDLPIVFYGVAFLYVYPSYIYGLDVVNLFKMHKETTVVVNLLLGVLVNSVFSSLFLYLEYGITGALLGSAIAQLTVMVLFKLSNQTSKNPVYNDH